MSLTPDQITMRRQGLTASDIVALSGTVPFKKAKTVYDVWLDKCHPDRVKPTEVTEAMELGHEAEPIIVRRVAKKRNLSVVYPHDTVRHPDIDWAMCTPDALIVNGAAHKASVVTVPIAAMPDSVVAADGLIECKLVGLHSARWWGDLDDEASETDGPPDYVYTQVVWQLFVKQLPYCIVAAMIGTEFRTYRVPFDESAQEYAQALVEIGAKFRCDHVLTERPPPIDGSESSRELLAALFQKSNGVQIKADAESEDAARVYFDAGRRIKEAKELQNKAKTVLMAKIQGNYGVRGDGWRCLWREQDGYHVDGYDVEPMRKFDLRAVKG
jgi:predicted phage-related endonuclease